MLYRRFLCPELIKNMLKLTFFYDVIENVPEFFSIDLHVLVGNVVRMSLITALLIKQNILWMYMLKV